MANLMERRLILHLGLSKTGTTSIQSFFRQNPDALAAAGIIYPKVGADNPNHPSLRPTALRPDVGEELNHEALALEIRRRRGDAGDAAIDTPLWSTAFRRIEESGAHTAIISYENFSAYSELYRFDVLASRLREFDVCGIVYLRRPDDWVTSLYGQLIRGKKRRVVPFAEFVRSLRTRLTYSTVLDTIRDHIPLDRLVVGKFEEAAASGLLEDFLDRTGLPPDQLLSAGDHRVRNNSLPHWAVLFLLRCNQAALPDEAFLDVRKVLTVSATRAQGPALRPGLDVATPDERRRLRDTAAVDADRLAERYGVTLSAIAHEPVAFRAFDPEDFKAIRESIAPRLNRSTQDALNDI